MRNILGDIMLKVFKKNTITKLEKESVRNLELISDLFTSYNNLSSKLNEANSIIESIVETLNEYKHKIAQQSEIIKYLVSTQDNKVDEEKKTLTYYEQISKIASGDFEEVQ